MQTLIPPQAGAYVAGQRTRDLILAARDARTQYANAALTGGDLTALNWAAAVLIFETELAARGIHVIAGPSAAASEEKAAEPGIDSPGIPEGDDV